MRDGERGGCARHRCSHRHGAMGSEQGGRDLGETAGIGLASSLGSGSTVVSLCRRRANVVAGDKIARGVEARRLHPLIGRDLS